MAAVLALVGGASARAQLTVATALNDFQSDVQNYNLVALGATATTTFGSGYGDTQGPLAVRGNLSLNGGSIADQPSNFGVNANPTLFVGGTLTLDGTTDLNSGYASISTSNSSNYTWDSSNKDLVANNSSGDLNITNSGSSTDPLGAAGPSGWNWSTEASSLSSVSTALAGATANGTTVVSGSIAVSGGNLDFTPSTTPAAGSTVIYTLTVGTGASGSNTINGSEYNGTTFSNIQINVPTDVNYVINVVGAAGSTLFPSGVNFNSGTNDNDLLWNFEGSSGTVTLGGGTFTGAVLAPNLTVASGSSTIVDGQVVANAFTDNSSTELHFIEFSAAGGIVPEPVTFALWGIGLCGLAIFARRRLIG